MIFLASLFGAPFPEKEQKKIVCGPVFGASLFKLWGLVFFYLGGFAFRGLAWTLWGPALFGSCARHVQIVLMKSKKIAL
jgi:hypothetical protein